MYYEERNGYIVIDDIYGGCGYEWSIKAALYHPEHKTFHLYEDGGCSCNSPYEVAYDGTIYWDAGKPLARHELIEDINRLRTDRIDDDFTVEKYNELAQAVRDFDPATVEEEI